MEALGAISPSIRVVGPIHTVARPDSRRMDYTATMSGEPDAVCFRDEDYASIGRRIGAWLLDFAFAFFILMVIMRAAQAAAPIELKTRMRSTDRVVSREAMNEWSRSEVGRKSTLRGFGAWFAACMLYYVAIRHLRGGTFGYRIVGIRLVDRSGNSPSLARLAGRFFLASMATFPLGASYLRCLSDPRRQSFHDRWSGTWMVRKRAVPAGPATTAYGGMVLGSYVLSYPVIEPFVPNETGAANSNDIDA